MSIKQCLPFFFLNRICLATILLWLPVNFVIPENTRVWSEGKPVDNLRRKKGEKVKNV